jgi:hypothetical protein
MISSREGTIRFGRVLGFALSCALLASLSSSQTSQNNPPPASFAAPPLFSVAGPEVGPTGLWSMAKGDFNGDHKTDFVVAGFNCASGPGNPADSIAVYTGNGDGTFQEPKYYGAGHCPNQVIVARLRGPTAPEDLIVVDLTDVSVLLGNGDGTFQDAKLIASFSPVSPTSISVGDFNGDGKADVAIALFTGLQDISATGLYDSIAVLLGNGDGSFQAPLFSQSPGNNNYQIAVADLNNDGKLDVITRTGLPETLYVSLGSGDGNFLPAYAIWSPPNTIYEAIASGMSGFTIGDFNNDGNLDIAADANGQRVEVLLGTGTGLFVPTASYLINQYQGGNGLGQITAEKLSNSGNVDLVVGTGYGATLVILRGNGDGTFQSPMIYPLAQDDDEGLIVADINGDGSPDIVIGTGSFGLQKYLTVLLNKGNGDFGAPPPLFPVIASYDQATQTNAVGVVLTDLTGSGKLDLVVSDWNEPIEPAVNGQMPALPTFNTATTQANTYSTISVLAGNGDGTFQTEQQYYVGGRRPISPQVADLTGDGKKDVVVANILDNNISILKGNGDRTFQSPINIAVGTNPNALVLANLSGDRSRNNKPDIAVTNLTDGTVSILINQSTPGTVKFADPVSYSVGTYPSGVVAQDFNHDGKVDLAIVDTGYFFASDDGGKHTQLAILLGNGDGTFQPAVTQKLWNQDGGDALIAADLGRGELDLAVAHFGLGQVMILTGKGDGTFTQSTLYGVGAGAEGMVAADFNRDGKLDIAVNALNDYSVALLLGYGDGTFVPPVQNTDDVARPFGWVACNFPAFITAGDLNGDGKPEIVTTHLFEAAVAVLRNLTVTPVRLVSAVSRKVQGSSGTFDVDLTNGNGIEFRSGGANGSYTLVFSFANPLTSVGEANVSTGSGSVASANIDPNDAHNYIVNLTGVTNAQTIKVSLSNVTDSVGNFSSATSAQMGVLVGDVDANGRVDGNDVSAVQSHTRQTLNTTNFRYDVNTSGVIDGNDVSITQGQTRTSLP